MTAPKRLPPWHEESISKTHNRSAFDCGEPELNAFLAQFARKNHDRGGSKTFVAVPDEDPSKILGYYSLSAASIAYARVPEIVAKGLPRYEVPVIRLGRLAVDQRCKNMALGSLLLAAAVRRTLIAAAEVGCIGLLIDAKNESVAKWYSRFGAIAFEDTPPALILPYSEIKDLKID